MPTRPISIRARKRKRSGPSRALDPVASAKRAHCRYVDDRCPGIRRIRHGKTFGYVDAHGRAIRDRRVLARIQSIAIPPAWTNVWICPSPHGHIQATGRDARGRKQYRYHARFREVRDENKYGRMLAFADALPKIRAAVDADMQLQKLERDKVLATLVRLLEISLIRVGNEEYSRANGSFGLTTLRTRHVDIHGSTIRFHFRGKSGVAHVVDIHDRRLARILQRCTDLPGQELFQYVDESGARHAVAATDVNEYLRRIAGDDFSAKDFRTWAGTVLAAHALKPLAFESATHAKRNVVQAVKSVAVRLGNTVSVCRKCYVHPAVFQAYAGGELRDTLERHSKGHVRGARAGLSSEEHAVVMLLRAHSEALLHGSRAA
jgi:DNA topoisomerase-1